MTKTKSTLQNQSASIRNLETQVGQIANMLNTKPQGALPSNIEPIHKGKKHIKVITLRNGRQLDEPIEKSNIDAIGKNEGKLIDPQPSEEKGEKKVLSHVKAYIPPIPFPHRLKKAQ